VRLRPIVASDRDGIIEIRQLDAVARWWRGNDLRREFDDDMAADDLHQFAIEVRKGTVVGMIQFGEEDDPDYRHASIDLFVDPAFHRQGIASDAIATMVKYLFEQKHHHRLVIDPSVENTAAIACYSKVGFKPVGIMRAYERRADGTWSDGLLMDLLRTDPRSNRIAVSEQP
jgi:aminoglycoside 6'-N-acetyltransferase